ncbi:hypothetical protein XaC1_503 [Xanthomonas phage XaC1]|nr:hypothetical protein XaC1_503 [Xanthomonas phage XaC1]
MIKVHEVQHNFNTYINLSEITDEHREIKDKIHQSINYLIGEGKYIQFRGSFGVVYSFDDSVEWMEEFRSLLPKSTLARESNIAILLD